MITVLGVDPGWENCGLAKLTMNERGEIRSQWARKISTAKQKESARIDRDDAHRGRQIWRAVADMASKVDTIAYEVYQPYGKHPSRSATTSMACGITMAVGFERLVPVIPVTPQQMRQELLGRTSGSKDVVAQAVLARVKGLARQIAGVAARDRSHITDAVAVGVVALGELTLSMMMESAP